MSNRKLLGAAVGALALLGVAVPAFSVTLPNSGVYNDDAAGVEVLLLYGRTANPEVDIDFTSDCRKGALSTESFNVDPNTGHFAQKVLVNVPGKPAGSAKVKGDFVPSAQAASRGFGGGEVIEPGSVEVHGTINYKTKSKCKDRIGPYVATYSGI